MTRRIIPTALIASLATGLATAEAPPTGDWILNLLRASMETKKGITLHVKGQPLAMIVTAIGDHFVEGRNQQSSRLVVRIASIDAAAMA